jgi:hypothetical protein
MADLKPKLRVDVNKNPTKAGIKVQFVLPQTIEGDKKAELTQKLQTKLNQGLGQYNLTISQDTDTPYANVIGFLIPIADVKLLIKKALGMGEEGQAEPAPEAAPTPEAVPEEPMKEIKRMQKLAGVKEAFDPFLDTELGGYMREYIDQVAEEEGLDLSYRDDFDQAFDMAFVLLNNEHPELRSNIKSILSHRESFF